MLVKFKNYLSIAIFAFLGGMARAALNAQLSFLGTFLGNIAGCLLLATLTYFFLEFNEFYDWLNLGLGTGFIGAFTTFSTFNLDTLKLFQAHHAIWAMTYFLGSIIFGFLFAYLGMNLGKKLGTAVRRRFQ
ncbi:MAG: CrcB family protein [Lactobacillus sp.]|nr:CrcB family protein [Lactobacillus sp.]MCH3906267.1 CrcB family protein [Lactobacillus sp.]MCH3990157.1 CrcB family protein [Lactobacillus sp.]MCH4069129.1 CrcB family protein [Lactobacillus sp.]MCI1303884.1 CrcB family protein [Lactobacillus sp.]